MREKAELDCSLISDLSTRENDLSLAGGREAGGERGRDREGGGSRIKWKESGFNVDVKAGSQHSS